MIICVQLFATPFPGENTGAGCHFLLQGTFLAHSSNLRLLPLLHWQADSLSPAPPRKREAPVLDLRLIQIYHVYWIAPILPYMNICRILIYASLESFIWSARMGEYQQEFYTEILYIKIIFPLYHTLKSGLFSKIIAVTPSHSNRSKILDSVFCYLLFSEFSFIVLHLLVQCLR